MAPASWMSGKHKGVAKVIKDKATFALYVHCHTHRLNLALVDTVIEVCAGCCRILCVDGKVVHFCQWLIYMYIADGLKSRVKCSNMWTDQSCRNYLTLDGLVDSLCCMQSCSWSFCSYCFFADWVSIWLPWHAHRAFEARSLLLAIDANFVVTLHMMSLMCDVFGKLQCLSSMPSY